VEGRRGRRCPVAARMPPSPPPRKLPRRRCRSRAGTPGARPRTK
jgi:hypothetical protein